jgi:hypothetical protein
VPKAIPLLAGHRLGLLDELAEPIQLFLGAL